MLVNVDGVKLYKSSDVEFWPILGNLFCNPDLYLPFVIAICCGKGKPKNVDFYFEEFIKESNEMIADGITVEGKHLTFKIMCFLCKKPARSLAKQVKGHAGYYACERCIARGVRVGNRMTFPTLLDLLRTYESFINFENTKHHIGVSTVSLNGA